MAHHSINYIMDPSHSEVPDRVKVYHNHNNNMDTTPNITRAKAKVKVKDQEDTDTIMDTHPSRTRNHTRIHTGNLMDLDHPTSDIDTTMLLESANGMMWKKMTNLMMRMKKWRNREYHIQFSLVQTMRMVTGSSIHRLGSRITDKG